MKSCYQRSGDDVVESPLQDTFEIYFFRRVCSFCSGSLLKYLALSESLYPKWLPGHWRNERLPPKSQNIGHPRSGAVPVQNDSSLLFRPLTTAFHSDDIVRSDRAVKALKG